MEQAAEAASRPGSAVAEATGDEHKASRR